MSYPGRFNPQPSYEVGDTIEYQPFGGGRRRVRVTGKEADIKNGRAGFDGVVVAGPDDGMTVWGYDGQITAVLT